MNTELGPCESLRAGEIRFTSSPRRPWWTPDRLGVVQDEESTSFAREAIA